MTKVKNKLKKIMTRNAESLVQGGLHRPCVTLEVAEDENDDEDFCTAVGTHLQS